MQTHGPSTSVEGVESHPPRLSLPSQVIAQSTAMSCQLLPKDRLEIELRDVVTEFAAERSKIARGARGFGSLSLWPSSL